MRWRGERATVIFAVLFRTNIQPRLLMEQMMEYNIPFRTRDRIPNLYEHWIARDIFAYIRIAQGSRERRDFLQIMNRPKRYISRDSLDEDTVAFGCVGMVFQRGGTAVGGGADRHAGA